MHIPVSIAPAGGLTVGQYTVRQQAIGAIDNFDALLAAFDTGKSTRESRGAGGILGAGDVAGFIDSLFSQLSGPLAANPFALPAGAGTFPFSPLFEATFGLSGPLPDYITRITASLGLDATKNLALQTIAINNKDATPSNESVARIAAELKAAGIAA